MSPGASGRSKGHHSHTTGIEGGHRCPVTTHPQRRRHPPTKGRSSRTRSRAWSPRPIHRHLEDAGRTLDSDVDNVTARTSFEWLPGGHFLVQRFAADFMGMDIQSFEVIGYDPETGTFPSTVYANMAPIPLPYRWEIDGDELKINADRSARHSTADGTRTAPSSPAAGDPTPAMKRPGKYPVRHLGQPGRVGDGD